MAEISKINVAGVEYSLKDTTARESVATLESSKADSATTLAGYGITDAYTKEEVDAAITAKSIDMDATMSDTSTNAVQNKVIKAYVDNTLNTLNSGLDWKESVATYSDLATTYADAEDGWTVNVKDTDITYRYTGSEWIAISANSIPMADSSTNGKMSSAHYTKVENLTMSVDGENLTLAE